MCRNHADIAFLMRADRGANLEELVGFTGLEKGEIFGPLTGWFCGLIGGKDGQIRRRKRERK